MSTLFLRLISITLLASSFTIDACFRIHAQCRAVKPPYDIKKA